MLKYICLESKPWDSNVKALQLRFMHSTYTSHDLPATHDICLQKSLTEPLIAPTCSLRPIGDSRLGLNSVSTGLNRPGKEKESHKLKHADARPVLRIRKWHWKLWQVLSRILPHSSSTLLSSKVKEFERGSW